MRFSFSPPGGTIGNRRRTHSATGRRHASRGMRTGIPEGGKAGGDLPIASHGASAARKSRDAFRIFAPLDPKQIVEAHRATIPREKEQARRRGTRLRRPPSWCAWPAAEREARLGKSYAAAQFRRRGDCRRQQASAVATSAGEEVIPAPAPTKYVSTPALRKKGGRDEEDARCRHPVGAGKATTRRRPRP